MDEYKPLTPGFRFPDGHQKEALPFADDTDVITA